MCFPPVGSAVKICLPCGSLRRHDFCLWVGKIPWRRAWQPTPVFLSGESHAQRSLAGYSPQGLKGTDTPEATQHWQDTAHFRKIPWRRAWQPTPVFLSGESHEQRSLAGYSPQGLKETDTPEATQHWQGTAHFPTIHKSVSSLSCELIIFLFRLIFSV